MSAPAPAAGWLERNQEALTARITLVKRHLARHAGGQGEVRDDPPADEPAALARLVEVFGLSGFESDILVLCAGMELDGALAALCAAAQGDGIAQPSFGLALAALPAPHWSALAPDAALRAWRLVELGAGPVLTRAPLRIDERVLHFLVGVNRLDERLAALLDPLEPVEADSLVPSQAAVAARLAGVWGEAGRGPGLPIVQLSGPAAACRPVASAAARLLGLRVAAIPAERLPANAADLDSLLRLWEREAALSGLGVLLVDCDDAVAAESEPGRARDAAINRLLERASGPVILREREARRIVYRARAVLEVALPLVPEQHAAWQARLGPALGDDGVLAAAAAQFSLDVPAIDAIAAEALAAAAPPQLADTVWALCRQRLRGALDGLASRITSDLGWDDLVLPAAQKTTLRAIAAQLRQRMKVHDEWGFAAKSRRGLGLAALFHGPSGTGKTMAAEVLANALRLDLYHIDLSRIVSKYIGETEKNLRLVFDAAEENGAVLLFDEADSLFGSRSEVKDSHDRYANIEVSYLLQRMEAYRGLAILTTNMRGALDPAFLRRLRFAVPFSLPDTAQRAEIWRGVFPAAAPTQGLDYERLALLRVAGGNIRNIALNAAFLAAEEGAPVGMAQLRAAATAEYAKLERRFTQAEAAAWG